MAVARSGRTRSSTRRGNSRPITAATRSTSRDAGIEPLETSEQDILTLSGTSIVSDRRSQPDFVAVPFEQAAFLQATAGPPPRRTDCHRSSHRGAAAARPRAPAHRASAQAIAAVSAARDPGQGQLRAEGARRQWQRVTRAVGRAQQNPARPQALGHHRQEFARRLIHPVQVLEHDDERAGFGRRMEKLPIASKMPARRSFGSSGASDASPAIDREQRTKERHRAAEPRQTGRSRGRSARRSPASESLAWTANARLSRSISG